MMSVQKLKLQEMTFLFQTNCYVCWSSASWEVAGYHFADEKKRAKYFPLLPHVTISVTSLNYLYLDSCFFPILFSCLHPDEDEMGRAAWWVPGILPRATHHTLSPPSSSDVQKCSQRTPCVIQDTVKVWCQPMSWAPLPQHLELHLFHGHYSYSCCWLSHLLLVLAISS